jgi:penicillin-binding protein 1C
VEHPHPWGLHPHHAVGWLLDQQLKAGRNGRSLWQKVGQSWSAARLEQDWSKAEILEAYLNLVAFRGELVGLSALSSTLFGKLPSGLNQEESAITVALIRAPNAAVEKVSARACQLLHELGQPARCDVVAIHTSQALARSRAANPQAEQDAPHFTRKLLQRQPMAQGGVVRSTLDQTLQRYATAVLRRQLAALAQRNVQDGALVVWTMPAATSWPGWAPAVPVCPVPPRWMASPRCARPVPPSSPSCISWPCSAVT